MSDFFTNLIARSFAAPPAIQPRLPSLFESTEIISTPADPIPSPSHEPRVAHATTPPTSVASVPPPASKLETAAPLTTASPAVPFVAPRKTTETELPAPPTSVFSLRTNRETSSRAVTSERNSSTVSSTPTSDHASSAVTASPPPHDPSVPRPASAPRALTASPGRTPVARSKGTIISPRQTRTPRQFEHPVSDSTPTIHVTIGRVEVRAVPAPLPTPQPARRAAPPKLSLADYLQNRHGGAR